MSIHARKNSEMMILSEKSPSLTTIKNAYGDQVLSTFLNSYIADAIAFYGMTEKIQYSQAMSISDTIRFNGYDLKASEIALFFIMMKSGQFRDANGNDCAKMYGSFNGEVVSDCLFRFRQYRSRVIEEYEARQRVERIKEMNRNAATPEQRDAILRQGMAKHSLLADIALGNGWVDSAAYDEAKLARERDKAIKHQKDLIKMLELQIELADEGRKSNFIRAIDEAKQKLEQLTNSNNQ